MGIRGRIWPSPLRGYDADPIRNRRIRHDGPGAARVGDDDRWGRAAGVLEIAASVGMPGCVDAGSAPNIRRNRVIRTVLDAEQTALRKNGRGLGGHRAAGL
jgi:hypothetical protein